MIHRHSGSARTAIAVLGLTVASVAMAQDDAEIPEINPGFEIGRFQMFSPAGNGIMSSVPFLYDTATGRVWRVFTNCADEEAANGCLVEIPSYPETDDRAAIVLAAIRRAMEEASETEHEQDSDSASDAN